MTVNNNSKRSGVAAAALAVMTALGVGSVALKSTQAPTPITCPETVKKDARGEPRNKAGQIRWCWPGEAKCFCDRDRDCYRLEGYVPCVPPTTAIDAGVRDVPLDLAADIRDTAVDVRDTGIDVRDTGVDRPDVRDVAVDTRDVQDVADVRDATVDRVDVVVDVVVVPPVDAPPTDIPPVNSTLVAFPGAEGFGASTTGGRGGRVIYVTNLNSSGAGSFLQAVQTPGPKYILFRVSGVINGDIDITQGDMTIAGQTSPGGITVHGIHCDNVYDPNQCRNVIMRHIRSRNPGEDCLRMGGTDHFIVDHCSLENAGDESIELSRSHDVTVQYSVIAEPVGDHYRWGGLLVNYSKTTMPLDNLSIHHNVWNGCAGRLPELTCEENGDGISGVSNCRGRTLHIDLVNNVQFDVYDPLWYNRCTSNNQGNDCTPSSNDFLLNLNWQSNVMVRRSTVGSGFPMINGDIGRGANLVFYNNNILSNGPSSASGTVPQQSQASRFPYPTITVLPSATLMTALQGVVGAFPRDPMDVRLAGYLSASVESRPVAWTSTGVNRGDGNQVVSPVVAFPTDTDLDGMPDAWETAHGLNPALQDHNGTGLSVSFTGVAGYTNLECYLNELSARRVQGLY